MQPPDELRPCPLCAHEEPQLTALGDERVGFVLVMCSECGLSARAQPATILWATQHICGTRGTALIDHVAADRPFTPFLRVGKNDTRGHEWPHARVVGSKLDCVE